MDLDSGAGLLHRLTSYEPDREWDAAVADPRVRHDLTPNDPSTLPPPVKEYDSALPTTPLPRELPAPALSATAVLAGHVGKGAELDAARLGRVLFLGAGVVRTRDWPAAAQQGGKILFRAAGSAGGRFPLEVYASTRGVKDVPDGVHWYDPVEHALRRVGPPADGDATTLVVTGVPWRTAWRYAERGWRHLYWDAGTLLAQLQAAAASAGFEPRLRTLFPDARVATLVAADGVDEYPLALLTLGAGTPAIEASGPAAEGSLPHVEHALCTAAQRAGDRGVLGEPWSDGETLAEVPAAADLDEVVLRRGSQRLMDPTRTLPRATMEWSLRAALRGIDVTHWVAVHRVDDVSPGIYRWPDFETPVRPGDHREELYRVCLEQSLPRDAAFVVIGAARLDALDDRTYRAAQLAAGLVEGRLHVAAYALGASASGMTFLDSEVPALLGQPDELATLLFTCVGVPAYTSRAGGGPGAPVEMRTVRPRLGS